MWGHHLHNLPVSVWPSAAVVQPLILAISSALSYNWELLTISGFSGCLQWYVRTIWHRFRAPKVGQHSTDSHPLPAWISKLLPRLCIKVKAVPSQPLVACSCCRIVVGMNVNALPNLVSEGEANNAALLYKTWPLSYWSPSCISSSCFHTIWAQTDQHTFTDIFSSLASGVLGRYIPAVLLLLEIYNLQPPPSLMHVNIHSKQELTIRNLKTVPSCSLAAFLSRPVPVQTALNTAGRHGFQECFETRALRPYGAGRFVLVL